MLIFFFDKNMVFIYLLIIGLIKTPRLVSNDIDQIINGFYKHFGIAFKIRSDIKN